MTKVHANNDNDILVIETENFQNTEEQNISHLNVEKEQSKSATKPLENDHEHRAFNQNTTNSNNEGNKRSC